MPTFTQNAPSADIDGVGAFIQARFPNTQVTLRTSGGLVLGIDMPTIPQADFDQLITDLTATFPAAMTLGSSYFLPLIIMPTTAAITWTAMPAAVTEFLGLTIHRTAAFLATVTQARLVVNVASAGATGARLAAQGSIDNGATWQFLDGSGSASAANSILIDSTGLKTQGVITLPTAARGQSVLLRIVGGAGNGTVSPTFGSIQLQMR